MFTKKHSSIHTKLICSLLGVVLLAFFMFLGVWIWYLQDESRSNMIDNMELRIRESNNLFEIQLKEIRNLMVQTALFSQGKRSEELFDLLTEEEIMSPQEKLRNSIEVSKYMEDLWSVRSYCGGVSIGNSEKIKISYGTTRTFKELSSYEWYHKKMDGDSDEIITSPYYINGEIHEANHIFSIVRPIQMRNKTTIGIMITDVKYKIFDDIYLPEDSYEVCIMNTKTGECIYSSEGDYKKQNFLKELKENYKKNNRLNGSFDMKYQKETMVLAYQKVNIGSWCVFGIARKSVYTNRFYQAAGKIVLLTLISCIGIGIVIYLLITYFTKNLLLLTNSVKSVSENNLEINLSIHTNDEIEELTDQFQLMMKRIRELLKKVKKEEAEKRKAEIKALQAQINPHFLYNTLNTIKVLAEFIGAENIHVITDSFMNLMHINMDGRNFISLKEEKEYLTNYLEIQKFRYIEEFTYEISLNVLMENYYIPKLLLQPLVENALLHGVMEKENSENGYIGVVFYEENNRLFIVIYDNGKGMKKTQINNIQQNKPQNRKRHIGIANIKERLELYFGENSSFEIESEEGEYTKLTLMIPLIIADEVENYV